MRNFFWEFIMMKYSRSNGNFRIAKIQFQVDEYTRLVEEETLIGKELYFLRINKFFGVKLPWFW